MPIFSACQIKPQKITEVSEQRAPNNFVPIILLQFQPIQLLSIEYLTFWIHFSEYYLGHIRFSVNLNLDTTQLACNS